jgi:hypothetical protein
LLIVREGKVQAENIKAFKKRFVSAGSSYLVNKDGEDQEYSDIGMINKFEWDLENLTGEQLQIDEMINMLGNPDLSVKKQELVLSEESEKSKSLKELIQIEINNFKRYDLDLQDYLTNETQFLNELMEIADKEKPKIQNDINCLSTTRSQCDLYSEKLLMGRGFPRTFGTPRFIDMIIEDLNKYRKDQDEKIVVAKSDKATLDTLIETRGILLKEIEKQYLEDKDLETIIPRLKDEKLRRK